MQVVVKAIAGERVMLVLAQGPDGTWQFSGWHRAAHGGERLPTPPCDALEARFATQEAAVRYFERLAGAER